MAIRHGEIPNIKLNYNGIKRPLYELGRTSGCSMGFSASSLTHEVSVTMPIYLEKVDAIQVGTTNPMCIPIYTRKDEKTLRNGLLPWRKR